MSDDAFIDRADDDPLLIDEGLGEDGGLLDEGVPYWKRLREDATLAAEEEHNTTFVQAVRRYPKAVFWSAIVSLCIIMDGYDGALMTNLFALPAFTEKYGHEIFNSGEYTLDARWQMALGMASTIGNCMGITLNGYLTERFGHKRVLLVALLVLTGFIFIQFFAPSVHYLFVGQLLCGIPWGIFTTMGPAFASEVSPLVLRSYLETWVVMCWGIGQLMAACLLYGLNTWDSQWAYRIPFGVQWVFPVIILLIAVFCPESPWWLVRNGFYDRAEESVMRLTSAEDEKAARKRAKTAVALMIETNKLELEQQKMSDDTTYRACFEGTNLRRTEIASATWGIQNLNGFIIQGYSTYFFEQAGLSPNDSFKMGLAIGIMHLVANLVSAVLTGRYGRRPLFILGCLGMGILMYVIGGLSFGPPNRVFGFTISAIYLAWFTIYSLTIAPLPYIINGEVSSTRLRSKTIAIARGTYLVSNVLSGLLSPYFLNPEWLGLRGKTGILTGSLCMVSLTWSWFRLPETGSRTDEELDILFSVQNLPARKFSKAIIHRDGDEIKVTWDAEDEEY